MTFTESNTVEAHLRDLLAGATPGRPAQFAPGLARAGGRVEGRANRKPAPLTRWAGPATKSTASTTRCGGRKVGGQGCAGHVRL